MNLRNNCVLEGRLTKDPVVFTNKDGSRKIMITVAVENNYKNRKGEKESQFIPLEAFISSKNENNGVYDHIHEGDLIGAQYEVRNNNYTKNGEKVFDLILFINQIDLKESKSVTDARLAKKQADEKNNPAA